MHSQPRFRILSATGLIGALPMASFAAGALDLSGRVDDSWGHPLPEVQVSLVSQGATASTDSAGAWRLSAGADGIRSSTSLRKLPESGRLAVVEGRLSLRFQGFDSDGSSGNDRPISVSNRRGASPRGASFAGATGDTLVFAWNGRARAKIPVESLVLGDLGTLVIDLTTPTIPLLSDTGGIGDVTTYGGVGNANPSSGGACNYGITGIANYAAIQVNQLPGDLQGQWDGGRMCGQCARIRAWTSTGWHTTVARIVDKCPDDHCGIDLGGAPATDIMEALPGRYSGSWSFVPCEGLAGVSDGPRSLWVKEGSSASWSLVQVRDPLSAVDSLRMRPPGGAWTSLAWATEAENFFKVPVELLQDSSANLQVEIDYRMAAPDTFQTKAALFTRGATSIGIP